ncbi:MAG: hypothetical protein ACLP9Y_12345 [Mycobacterium sp.]
MLAPNPGNQSVQAHPGVGGVVLQTTQLPLDYVREAGFEPEVYAGSDDGTGAEIVFAGRVRG